MTRLRAVPLRELGKPAILGLFFLLLSGTFAGTSEQSAQVHDYMTYHLGRWESTTRYFDAAGNVRKEEVDGYGEETLIEGQVNLHYSYNADGTVNTAFRFYSPGEDRFYMIDVTHKGSWWVLSGKRGEHTLASREKELSDGRKVIFKATHSNIRADSFEAEMELSFDGGATWRRMMHKHYRKIGEGAGREVSPTVFHGGFVWTGAGESGDGDLEASFAPSGPGAWEVVFRFEWRGTPYVYSGEAHGSLSGTIEGKVHNEDRNRNFTFTGSFEGGVFHGTHTEVGRGRPGRIEQTGTMTLSREP